MSVPTPTNLPLLIGSGIEATAVIERILKGQTDLQTNLLELSKFWKIKVWFDKPTEIRITPTWINKTETDGGWSKTRRPNKMGTEHVIARFFQTEQKQLCYLPKRSVRSGYHFPSLDSVIKYEPVIDRSKTEFTYEKFAAKFDRRFITESEIKRTWDHNSSQHGGRYTQSDFHQLGPEGKKVLRQFLRLFKGVTNTVGEYYSDREGNNKYLTERHKAHHRLGRDITIQHRLGNNFVWYSSEYYNCGNGRYGIIANENIFLWTEDD